jgi:hypothetical protein
MSEQIRQIFDDDTEDFKIRSLNNRFGTLGKSTMELLKSFMVDGDDYATAKLKTQQFSQEISVNYPAAKFDYCLGDTLVLVTAVNASTLPFITQAKKDLINSILTL